MEEVVRGIEVVWRSGRASGLISRTNYPLELIQSDLYTFIPSCYKRLIINTTRTKPIREKRRNNSELGVEQVKRIPVKEVFIVCSQIK
jgi:hypothetical protein